MYIYNISYPQSVDYAHFVMGMQSHFDGLFFSICMWTLKCGPENVVFIYTLFMVIVLEFNMIEQWMEKGLF